MDALRDDTRYTYADYASWDTEERYELIDGVPYLMGAPNEQHQDISMSLAYQLYAFLRGKPCKVFHAPFDVCLNAAGDDDTTVVQPDLLVVCDRTKLDGKRCNGAPELAIEILSPSSGGRDGFLKYQKYVRAGVGEYWIVDPETKTVHVHVLHDGKYTGTVYNGGDAVPVQTLEGCVISLADVFGG